MCINRHWKTLDASNNFGVIFATRSDGLLIQLFNIEFNSASEFIRKLEEFRNCQCSPDSPCSKHAEEKERLENARTR